jgi:hypothetical protein
LIQIRIWLSEREWIRERGAIEDEEGRKNPNFGFSDGMKALYMCHVVTT